ncbi:hypothetical protein D3C75_1311630 [compost metagenome]
MHRGAIGHAKGSSGGEVHAFGDGQHVVERHGHLFGERPPSGEGHHPVPDLEGTGALADSGNDTRRLATG